MFFVHLIEAKLNERDTEWFNPMDPFALIKVDRTTKRTHKWEEVAAKSQSNAPIITFCPRQSRKC